MRWGRALNSSPPRHQRGVRQPRRKLLKQSSSWRRTVPVSLTGQNLLWMEGAPPSEARTAHHHLLTRTFTKHVDVGRSWIRNQRFTQSSPHQGESSHEGSNEGYRVRGTLRASVYTRRRFKGERSV